MTWDTEEESKRRVEIEASALTKVVLKEQRKLQEENLEKHLKKQKEAATKYSMQLERDKQKEILESKSLNIRTYLLENLVPILTEGLLEVCKQQPEDPVDNLAEYLFKRSLDVPYPDPTTF